jgi:hypothetical protein
MCSAYSVPQEGKEKLDRETSTILAVALLLGCDLRTKLYLHETQILEKRGWKSLLPQQDAWHFNGYKVSVPELICTFKAGSDGLRHYERQRIVT